MHHQWSCYFKNKILFYILIIKDDKRYIYIYIAFVTNHLLSRPITSIVFSFARYLCDNGIGLYSTVAILPEPTSLVEPTSPVDHTSPVETTAHVETTTHVGPTSPVDTTTTEIALKTDEFRWVAFLTNHSFTYIVITDYNITTHLYSKLRLNFTIRSKNYCWSEILSGCL